MFKNEMVQMIIDLQKKGASVYLTDEGYREFLKLMGKDTDKIIHAIREFQQQNNIA